MFYRVSASAFTRQDGKLGKRYASMKRNIEKLETVTLLACLFYGIHVDGPYHRHVRQNPYNKIDTFFLYSAPPFAWIAVIPDNEVQLFIMFNYI